MESPTTHPASHGEPSEQDIRDYAFHLYQQSRCEPGRDLDNWLEATACLRADIPAHHSGTRLHQYVNGSGAVSLLAVEASILSS